MAPYIGENKFFNCILIGIGEVVTLLLSTKLISRFSDTLVFRVSAVIALAANGLFYAVPAGIGQ